MMSKTLRIFPHAHRRSYCIENAPRPHQNYAQNLQRKIVAAKTLQ